VAVESKETTGRWSAGASIEELSLLCRTAGASVVGKTIQKLPAPSSTHYVGQGKLEELITRREQLGYDVVIFDDELTPRQQRNLEEALQVKVIDRVALILDIFAHRAHTREGQLQVELAQHQYLLPRLAGQWSHLERLGGGIGTRGPGESQLETDRRLIRRKIQRLGKQIEEVRKHRALYRQKRLKSGLPVVSLVGYTNSGKSTLLNALCQAGVFTEDKLFATLDPTTRRLKLADGRTILMTDTVGFIHKLPPEIVTAFRATLEELDEASVLLHVVDLSSPDAAEQCQTVEDILSDLALAGKPRVTALNKIDLLLPDDREWDETDATGFLADQSAREKTVLVSAARKWGLARLMALVGQEIPHPVTAL
jgi:GTP-binding protein HflX